MRSTSLALVSEAIALLDMCQREPGILVLLAETLGNRLELLFSKAHLSKAFREAAHAALRHLKVISRTSTSASGGGRSTKHRWLLWPHGARTSRRWV